jgi:acyl carrier protein
MTRQKALRLLEETLELGPNTLTGEESLSDIPAWDSLSTLAFISMVDKQMGLVLRGNQVARCKKVNDLFGLLGIVADSRAA